MAIGGAHRFGLSGRYRLSYATRQRNADSNKAIEDIRLRPSHTSVVREVTEATELVHCWRHLAYEIKLRWKNSCCPLV